MKIKLSQIKACLLPVGLVCKLQSFNLYIIIDFNITIKDLNLSFKVQVLG